MPGTGPESKTRYEIAATNVAPGLSEVPFPQEEYDLRLTRLRSLMERDGIDTLFVQSPENLCYLSGYELAWYNGQPAIGRKPAAGIAINVDHDDFIMFENSMHAVIVRFHSTAKDVRFVDDGGVRRDPVEFIRNELSESGWLKGRVGLEMWSNRPVRAVSEMFQSAFEAEGASVVDGSHLVRELRSVKSPLELESFERAARIADIGLEAARDALRPGITELELWGETFAAMARAGGENQAIPMLVSSGPKAYSGHAHASTKQILPGEIVFLDVCGVYNRYHVDQARSFCIGEPDAEVMRNINLSAGVFNAVAPVLKPGVPVREFNRAVSEYYERVGISPRAFGYELGISFPPDWVGEYWYAIDEDPGDDAFQPGTVVNHESQLFLPGETGFSIIIDTMIVSRLQAGWASNFPHELVIV